MTPVGTAPDAIDALGGTSEAARLIGASYAAVYQWRTRGLPRNRRDAFERALSKKGFTALKSLWRQKEENE